MGSVHHIPSIYFSESSRAWYVYMKTNFAQDIYVQYQETRYPESRSYKKLNTLFILSNDAKYDTHTQPAHARLNVDEMLKVM